MHPSKTEKRTRNEKFINAKWRPKSLVILEAEADQLQISYRILFDYNTGSGSSFNIKQCSIYSKFRQEINGICFMDARQRLALACYLQECVFPGMWMSRHAATLLLIFSTL